MAYMAVAEALEKGILKEKKGVIYSARTPDWIDTAVDAEKTQRAMAQMAQIPAPQEPSIWVMEERYNMPTPFCCRYVDSRQIGFGYRNEELHCLYPKIFSAAPGTKVAAETTGCTYILHLDYLDPDSSVG